jgi:flagellar protein FlaG
MGFSVTATHLIIFIASVAIATGIASVASNNVDVISFGIKEKTAQTSEKMRTEIKIVHVAPKEASTSIYVLNIGSMVLDPNSTAVFIDGNWQDNLNISILNRSTNIENDFWDPKEIIVVNTTNVSIGRHTAKVVAGSAWDEYLFDR